MLVIQMQHFGLYPLVGKEKFAVYIAANNRAAIFPAILAALALAVLSLVLLFHRPAFFSLTVEHGAPLRLVAPMKLGLKNVKAITRISYTTDEPCGLLGQARVFTL